MSGLWTLLAPGGENVPLEALSGQRVAVDVSVWLVSLATAAAGSAAGESVRAACLAGLFARCCKLAFLRVRPVFVFDGPAPLLKRRTVQARRAARLAAARDAERARTRLWRLAEHKAQLARAGLLTATAQQPLPPAESDEDELRRLQSELDRLFAEAAPPCPETPVVDAGGAAGAAAGAGDEVYRLHVRHGEVARAQAETTRRLVAAYGADPSNPAHTAGEFSRAQVRAMQQKGALTHRLVQGRAAAAAAARTAGAGPVLRTVASDPHTQILFCPGVVDSTPVQHSENSTDECSGCADAPTAAPAQQGLEIEVDLGAPPGDDVMALMREMMASMEKEHQTEPSTHVLPGIVDHPESTSTSSSSDDEGEDDEDNGSAVVPFLVGQVQQPVQQQQPPHEAAKEEQEDKEENKEDKEVVVLDTSENEDENEEEENEEDEEDFDDLVLPFKTSARAMEAAHQQDEEDAFAAALAAPAAPVVTASDMLDEEEQPAEEQDAKRVPQVLPPPADAVEGDNLAAFGGVVEQCRELLRLFGIPCVVAPSEADCECAALERAGLVDAVLSDDSDVLLFGAQHVYRHAFAPGHHLEHYAMPAVTRATSFDRTDLVALALLLGSDYTLGVHGIGLVRAVEVLHVFGSSPAALRAFRAWCADPRAPLPVSPASASTAPPDPRVVRALRGAAPRLVFPALDWPSAAVVDGYEHPLVRTPTAPLAWGVPDVAALTRFCLLQLGWDVERAERTLQPVVQNWARALDTSSTSSSNNTAGIQRFLVVKPQQQPQFTRFRSGTQVAEMQKMSPAVLALMKSRADTKAAAAAAAAAQHSQPSSNP